MNNINEILKNITHGSLFENKLTDNIKSLEADRKYKAGCVAVVKNKANLSTANGTKGFIVHSTEKLAEVASEATHWTPNPYTYLKYEDAKRKYISGHRRDAIKQVSSFVFDIDEKITQHELEEAIINAHFDLKIPAPNLIIKTPRGYHLYFTVETPFYANRTTGFKAIKMAEKINSNLKHGLSKYLPIDPSCVPFGFFRVPNEDNILFYKSDLIETTELVKWSYEYSKANNINKPNKNKIIMFNNKNKTDKWVKEVLQTKSVKGNTDAGRNNVIFTLGLYYYSKDKEYEQTYNLLDEYNSNLYNPLNRREFDKVLEQAYSGNYGGVSREYAVNIINTYLSEEIEYTSKGWYKHKKPREQRQRSHNHERVQDIIDYLKEHTNVDTPFIEGSISDLTEKLSISRSTFYSILSKNQFDSIILKREGKGRYATAKLYLKELFMHRLLSMAKKVIEDNQNKKTSFRNALLSVLKSSDILNLAKHNESLYTAFLKRIEALPALYEAKQNKNIENLVLRI